MPRISILVAVYNSEKYLGECLDSLLRQTLKDIEIICIDDCSTDGSHELLEEYARKDGRIKVMHLAENHGQAYARNEGLKIATGEIIAYLDSDDWFAEDSLSSIYSSFSLYPSADCVLFRCRYVFPDGTTKDYDGENFSVKTGKEAFIDSLTWKIHGVYAARKALYDKIPYDCSSRNYSDDNTTRLHYYISHEVRQSDAPYFYRQHSGSVTHRVSVSRLDYMAATRSMKRQLEQLGCSKDIMSIHETVKWKVVIDTYKYYYQYKGQFSEADRQLFLAGLKQGWKELDTNLIPGEELRKRGQRPFAGHWRLFRLYTETIFTLRKLAGRL